jgi:hypothetical protein
MSDKWKIIYCPQTKRHTVASAPIIGGYKEGTLLSLGENLP